MTIHLKPEHEQLIAQALQTGAYHNADDVLARALQMLNSENQWLQEHGHEIAEKIERAFGQFERGQFFTAETSRIDMEHRKAAWLADKNR